VFIKLEMSQKHNILILFAILFTLVGNAQEEAPNCATKFDSLSNRQVYFFADSIPEFPGGKDALFAFLSENLKHPQHCIAGKVYLSFIVESTGKLTNKRIIRGIEKDANQEALSVVDKMPNWKPGICNGEAVPFLYVLPIGFSLK